VLFALPGLMTMDLPRPADDRRVVGGLLDSPQTLLTVPCWIGRHVPVRARERDGRVRFAGLGLIHHWARFETRWCGLYRVFNSACYRFYRSNSGPPAESDTPYATAAALPATPSDTFADGSWWISVDYFNGAVGSGFLPIGPNGETYIRIEVVGGVQKGAPSGQPGEASLPAVGTWSLVERSGGVLAVTSIYNEADSVRADDWCIAWTNDGTDPSTPPTVSGTTTVTYVAMTGANLSILDYELPAQSDSVTVKVRLSVRRDRGGGDYVYSEDSTIAEHKISRTGPTAPR